MRDEGLVAYESMRLIGGADGRVGADRQLPAVPGSISDARAVGITP